MARTLKYVCPSIVFKQQFNDDLPIFNDLESGSWKSYCDKIFASNPVIVTSSPGMGKSRLLRELFSEAKDYNFEACFLDLKGIGNRELERALSEFSSKWIPQSNSKFYDQTCDFQLDDDKRKVFCLDALDECAGNAQEKILAAALDFNHVRPRDIVVLSCREVVSKRHQITIDNRNALHAQIQDFHEGSVRGMLDHNGINNDQFIQVWHKLSTGWSFRSIRSPRDVEAFLELVEIHGFEQAIGKSVAEVYDAIIVHRLRDEGNKFGKNHTAITQRLLERLALSMLVYGQSQITGDELMTFFEEIDSAIGNTFLQQVKLEYLYERALLDHNTFSDTIQFQNKEIQEYLAAKAINRFANSLQGTFNLIFNVDHEEFKPQWTNTIKLLCGINPKLILPIVDFISKRKSEFDYEILEAALSADWGNSHIFSEQEKHEILIKSLSHYFLQGRYFSYSMDRNFAKFVTSNSTQKLLFDNFQLYGEEIDCVIPSIFRIVRTFHELGIDGVDYSFWSNRAKDRILGNNEKDLIKETALELHGELGTFHWLEDIESYIKSGSRRIQERWVRALHEANPNSLFTLQKVSNAYNSRLFSIHPVPKIFEVTAPDGVINCLNLLQNGDNLFNSISYKSSYDREGFTEFPLICDRLWNSAIQDSVIALINKRSAHRLLKKMAPLFDLVRKKVPGYAVKFAIENRDQLHTYDKGEKLLRLVNERTLEEIFEKFRSESWDMRPVHRFLFDVSFHRDEQAKSIFHVGKKHFANELKTLEEERKNRPKEDWELQHETQQTEDLQVFRSQLTDGTSDFAKEVIEAFILSNTDLTTIWSKHDEQLFHRALQMALSQDVSECQVEYKVSHEGYSFQQDEKLQTFNSALTLSNEHGFDIQPFRTNIIKAIPVLISIDLTGYNDSLKRMESLMPLSEGEIDLAVNCFLQIPSSASILTATTNLLDFGEKFRPVKLLLLLQEIVKNNSSQLFGAHRYLDLIESLSSSPQFYKNVFESIPDDNNPIKEHCNALLIKHSADNRRSAVQWRTEQIKARLKEYEPNTVGTRDYQEPEYDQNKFNLPLTTINDPSLLELYKGLLKFSLEQYKRGESFHSYCDYIWKVVFSYLDNIVSYKGVSSFNQVKELIENTNAFTESRFLQGRFFDSKKRYIGEQSASDNILQAITEVNELRKKSFLKVRSAKELQLLIEDIIDKDLRNWVEMEGAYQVIKRSVGKQEDLIQKTIKSEFQNALLRRGFRPKEIQFMREEQLLDDKRIDFSIIHGFIGKVFVELKRTNNSEITNKSKRIEYKNKMLQYQKGSHSDYGIYLIFQTRKSSPLSRYEPELKELYADTNISVVGLNCLSDE